MGYQLWYSPITGYRRKGTRLAELRLLLGSGITAHAILEPLQSCPADATAAEMSLILRKRGFDVAGVKSEQDGPVIGYVAKEWLRAGVVRDCMQPLTADKIISDATPLPAVLSVLKDRHHTFVLVGPEIRGILTRADLNKPPVRVYLFGLISLLEMHLTFWVRASYEKDTWQNSLKKKRVDMAKKLQIERRTRKQETTLVECLQFCDKRDLVIARNDLRDKLGLGTKDSARTLLKSAENLRNVLFHSQQDIVHGSTWQITIGLIERVEAVVQTSDQLVEQQAISPAEPGAELWASA